jgi:hypothetical protein
MNANDTPTLDEALRELVSAEDFLEYFGKRRIHLK